MANMTIILRIGNLMLRTISEIFLIDFHYFTASIDEALSTER